MMPGFYLAFIFLKGDLMLDLTESIARGKRTAKRQFVRHVTNRSKRQK